MAGAKKRINLGVVMDEGDDRDLFLEVAGSDPTINRVIAPRDPDQLFRYLGQLSRKGIQVERMVMIGHGSKGGGQHVGKLKPVDVDLKYIKQNREDCIRLQQNMGEEASLLRARLKATKDRAERRKLQSALQKAESRFTAAETYYKEYTQRQRLLEDAEDAMAKDAVIGLINCHVAADEAGKGFMRKISDVLLAKRGGRIVGNEKTVTVKKLHWAFAHVMKTDDILVEPAGKWYEIDTRATGRSNRTCGARCRDFDTYGFCDRPAPKGGGACWMHR